MGLKGVETGRDYSERTRGGERDCNNRGAIKGTGVM